MDIEINDEYGYKKDYSYLNKVIETALEKEQVLNAVFSITFVSDDTIKRINKEYRNIDKVTDVISFAFEDSSSFVNPECRVLGDIYICIPRMQEQAESFGHGEMRELSFLTVHGILHLLGYDHMNKEEEKIMFERQELILNAAGIQR